MQKESNKKEWGFIRETKEKAIEAKNDPDTGVCRTGLDEYLEIIFPGRVWIHDTAFGNHGDKNYRIRPDYRCDEFKIIVEFDGLQHYQSPEKIRIDKKNTQIYESFDYKVIRIPYFIQLTNDVVKELFGVEISECLFPKDVPSMGPKGKNTPAYCCPAGVARMANEFIRFPQQYEVNMKALIAMNDEFLSGAKLLQDEIYRIKHKNIIIE